MSKGTVRKERIFDRCAFRDCKNGRISTGSHLFHFPQVDDPRHDVWVQYTANPRLKTWSALSLRAAGLCASHFQPSDFNAKGKLHRNAVPIPFFAPEEVEDCNNADASHLSTNQSSSVQEELFCPLKETEQSTTVETPTLVTPTVVTAVEPPDPPEELMKVEKADLSFDAEMTSTTRKYEKRAFLSFEENEDEEMAWNAIEPYSAETTIDHLPVMRKQPYRRRVNRSNRDLTVLLEQCRKQNKLLQQRVRRMSNRMKTIKKMKTVDDFLDEEKCTEPAARAMVKLQLHQKNAPYADDEKKLAIQLFYYSTTAYKGLLKDGCRFPSISAVRMWISETDTRTESTNCESS